MRCLRRRTWPRPHLILVSRSSWLRSIDRLRSADKYAIRPFHVNVPEAEPGRRDRASRWCRSRSLARCGRRDRCRRSQSRQSYHLRDCGPGSSSRQLRCKEIWVVGADRYRNPDDDLPADFEAQREPYYQALDLPLDAGRFIAELPTRCGWRCIRSMTGCRQTAAFGSPQGRRQDHVTPLDAQPDPPI